MKSALQLTGVGLRPEHYADVIDQKPGLAWLEVPSEVYFAEGGHAITMLTQIREFYPISLHGMSMSLGSTDELNWQYLKSLRDLMQRIDPCLISDHLAWCSIDGQYLHDLLPLPYTEESLEHLVPRIQQVQDYLGKQLLIENIASYLSYDHSTIPEWQFLTELANRAGCGVLLDLTNVYVSSTNLGFDPLRYVSGLTSAVIQEIHVSGFSSTILDEKEVLIDSHNRLIVPAVWDLYRYAIQHLGTKPTIIEWDSDLPPLATLCLEAYRAEQIMRNAHAAAKLAG